MIVYKSVMDNDNGGSGGGHTIENSEGTSLVQRDVLQFREGFLAEDDDTNEKTVISPNVMQSGDMDDVITPLPSVQPRYHKYSTTEQVIGEWIDGKPLYQKSFFATNVEISAGLTTIGDLTGLSIDRGYILKVFGMDSDYSYAESRIDAWLRLPNNNIGLKVVVGGASSMNLSYVAVTIQYTKTTDTPNT